MLPLDLFRNRTYAGANLVMLLVALAMFGVFFFLSLYMQNVLGYSAVQTGAAFLPMTILIILIAPVAGKTSDRFGSRWLMTAGMILISVQLLYFSRLGVDASFWDLLPAFVVGGVGMALTMTPSAAAATRSVSVDKAGVGAAVLNASRQIGGSLGIALIGAIIAFEAGDGVRTAGGVRRRPPDGAPRRLWHRSSRCDRGVFARASPRSRAPRRSGRRGADRMTATPSTRLPAEERRRKLVDAGSTRLLRGKLCRRDHRADRARKPASPSPSSIGTSPPSESSTSRAWTPRGSGSALRIEDRIGELGPESGLAGDRPGDDARDEGAAARASGCRRSRRPGRIPRSAATCAGTCAQVHDFFADVLRRVQEEGGIHPDRDPDTEAWIFVAGSLLVSVADRLGGLLKAEDFEAIRAERLRWLTGE